MRTKLVRPDSYINDAWLGLGDLNGLEIDLPLMDRTEEEINNPGLRELRVMKDTNYLAFAAKSLLGVDLLPEQAAIVEELWIRPFPMYIASRGFGKSYLMAIVCMLKAALVPGTKIVIVGAAFRQARVIYEYCEKIWHDAPVLRSICTNDSGPRQAVDRCSVIVNDSSIIAIPLGDGSKIRGMRAHIIIADEFASIPPSIYETVVQGFAAVSAKPVDNVKERFKRDAMKKAGIWTAEAEIEFMNRASNQCIIAGTADYDFMHFADYWKKYYVYVKSRGEPERPVRLPNGEIRTLKSLFPDGKIEDAWSYRDYCIMRIPYELIPKGFMDDKVVARAKVSSEKSSYLREYGACFPKDSEGFFKRSLIESCVATMKNIGDLGWPAWCDEPFHVTLKGTPGRKYVVAVDPAAVDDNFSVVILELWPEHSRIVYCWTTNMQDFKARKRAGLTEDENDYYSYCAKKIRSLLKLFPSEDLVIDAQGGGNVIIEALQDPARTPPGEQPLLPTNRILKPEKEDELDVPGKRIIHVFEFANYRWTSEANHGTRMDLSDKSLLFPEFDPVTLEIASHKDAEMAKRLKTDRLYDTVENATMEIEALKDELASIIMMRTGTGVNARDRWDTPEVKTPDGKKARTKKDRYSSLVMANYIARQMRMQPVPVEYAVIGGRASQIAAASRGGQKTLDGKKNPNAILYNGPDWFTQGMGNGFGFGAVRRD